MDWAEGSAVILSPCALVLSPTPRDQGPWQRRICCYATSLLSPMAPATGVRSPSNHPLSHRAERTYRPNPTYICKSNKANQMNTLSPKTLLKPPRGEGGPVEISRKLPGIKKKSHPLTIFLAVGYTARWGALVRFGEP